MATWQRRACRPCSSLHARPSRARALGRCEVSSRSAAPSTRSRLSRPGDDLRSSARRSWPARSLAYHDGATAASGSPSRGSIFVTGAPSQRSRAAAAGPGTVTASVTARTPRSAPSVMGRQYTRFVPQDALASEALAAIDRARNDLVELSLAIHREPELAYQERKASARIAAFLSQRGFRVRKPYAGIETSFRADAGKGAPTVAVLCEYDALPDIGHACGHNLIAMMGAAAGVGGGAVLDRLRGTAPVDGPPAPAGPGWQ